MARLGRSYARSRLGKPTVVGAPVTFRPVKVNLSVELTRRAVPPQRVVRSRLRPPTVVGPATVFRPAKVTLAPSPRQARATHSHPLQPAPQAAPPVTYPPVKVTLAASSRLARGTHSRRITPAVVAPPTTFGPIAIKLVRTPRQSAAPHSKLRPPTAIGAPTVFGQMAVKLAASSRLARATHSFRTALPPPTAVVVSPLLIPMRVVLTASTRLARAAHSRLAPPTTTAAATTYTPLLVKLAAGRVQARHRRTRSFSTLVPQFPVVPPPTLEQLKPRVFLTRRGPVRLVQSKLKRPAVIAPGLVFAPIKMTLAPSTRIARTPHSKLRAPTVISFPVTLEQRIVRLHLAPSPKQGRRTMWKLRPPTVVGAFVNLAPPYLEGDPGDTDTAGGYGSTDLEGTAGVSG